MNIISYICIFVIIFCTFNFPSFSTSATTNQEIGKAYISSNYEIAIKFLEQNLEEHKQKLSSSEKVEFSQLYKDYLLLAYIYAWKLNKPDIALLKYKELNELRKLYPQPSDLPHFEFLYIAEIYETKNDYAKATEYYQYLLNELASAAEKKTDAVSIILNDDLIKFVKYQLDGLDLKKGIKKYGKPLLTRLKLSSQLNHYVMPLVVMALVPGAEYHLSDQRSGDMISKIKQSPSDLSSTILNYSLILVSAAGYVDESSEKAMEAYLIKYPESYYSLHLRYLFYLYYKKQGENIKAEKLEKEFNKIAKKRGMELIFDADKRFSSPEKTWDTYRNALITGDIDLALECYIPGQWRNKKMLILLGKEKMKELGHDIGAIEKITSDDTQAGYMIKRNQKGKDMAYKILFHNIGGEWKIKKF